MRQLRSCSGPLLLVFVLSAVARGETLRVVTLGDSITKGVRSGVTAEQTFAARLEASLRRQGLRVEVRNVGIGGERTDQAVQRLQRNVLDARPHLVTIMYGTNDSYVDKGATESRISADEYRTHLLALVERLRAAGVVPVLMTEPAWAEESRNGIGEDPNVRLAAYMEACRAVAKQAECPLVDHFAHWSAVAAKGTKLRPWTTDGCHPNPRGHEELAHRITQVVLPLAQRLADRHDAWDDGPFRVQLDVLSRGYDGKRCWVHPRAGALPTQPPTVVLTMQPLLLTGSDVFYALHELRSDDGGTRWSPLREHAETLGRRNEGDGVIVAACDFTPKWHAASGRLLGIGHTVRYRDEKVIENRRRETCYSVYDAAARSWSPWTTLPMPEPDGKFFNAGAGSVQRIDLPDGDILLPIYFRGQDEKHYRVTVLRCAFDGRTLRFVSQGNELSLASGRGLYEPSLDRCGGRYFLTLRNDTAGYVAASDDGQRFGPVRRWTWDDGSDLPTYNTQQHWVTHGDALYLVYTRRESNNDHVFRHRAPLFIARVDRERLCVVRATERILVPERGARLGNFAVADVSDRETWVTVAEWMQTWPPQIVIRPDNLYGADNSVYAARIRWPDAR